MVGVGPAGQLKALRIDVVRDSRAVGGNLQEHARFAVSRTVDIPTCNVMAGPLSVGWTCYATPSSVAGCSRPVR